MSDKNINDSAIAVKKFDDYLSQGDLLFWRCEYEKAKEHFQILLNQPSINQLDLVRCYNSLGAVNAKLQNYEEALNNYREQLDILLKLEPLNKKESDIAKCYMSIGKVYWLKQDYALAIDSYRKALDIVSTITIASDLRSDIYKDLANLFTKKREFDSAIKHFEEALVIDRDQLRENHPKFGQTYADMGAMYYSQRDYKQALNYFMKARETWQKSLASTHIYIESMEKTIHRVQSQLDDEARIMSENNSQLNELWDQLSTTMKKMFELQPLTRESYMKLFNDVAKYFSSTAYNDNLLREYGAVGIKPKPSNSTNQPTNETKKPADEKENEQVDDRTIPGSELYFRLKDFLRNYLVGTAENGNNLEGEDFLRLYAKTWERYRFVCRAIDGMFHQMNKVWLARQRLCGHKNIHDVYTMAMRIWYDLFFKESNRSLTRTCLNLIKDERNGKLIDLHLIRQVVQSYISIGYIETDGKNLNNRTLTPVLTIYNEYFEKEFLQETEQFYQFQSNGFLENNSTNYYIKKVTKRLKEEEHCVNEYLHPKTIEKLMPKIQEILITNQLDRIYIEAEELIHKEKIEDLRILFELVNRIGAHQPIQKCFEEYAYKIGEDLINSRSAAAIKDLKFYVETLSEIYTRFFTIVKEGFCCEPGYMSAFNTVCRKLFNNNAITRETEKSTSELLARCCDMLLRKGNRTEEGDFEEKTNQIMIILNYVEDKDVFQKFYGKMLAKRLFGQLSASDDHEKSLISKLKEARGFDYASRLQRMFQDFSLSTTLSDEYEKYCENKRLTDIVDFSVMVLTSNAWPFTAPTPFILPNEFKRTFESFTNFYTTQHNGRKLEWLHQHSKGELQTLYTKPKYIIQISVYQMTILLLFNEYNNMTVEKMLDTTLIESELFVQVLVTLLKSKVLICSEIDAENVEESDIKKEYTIQVDETFKSKKIKFNLNQAIKSVEQKDTEAVNQSIDEDRKMLIQAAIVRIMKARKELKHALLIQEVIPQLTSRFQPQIPMIKKCIYILIEKEYLERDDKEKDVYRYLA